MPERRKLVPAYRLKPTASVRRDKKKAPILEFCEVRQSAISHCLLVWQPEVNKIA